MNGLRYLCAVVSFLAALIVTFICVHTARSLYIIFGTVAALTLHLCVILGVGWPQAFPDLAPRYRRWYWGLILLVGIQFLWLPVALSFGVFLGYWFLLHGAGVREDGEPAATDPLMAFTADEQEEALTDSIRPHI